MSVRSPSIAVKRLRPALRRRNRSLRLSQPPTAIVVFDQASIAQPMQGCHNAPAWRTGEFDPELPFEIGVANGR